MMFVTVLLPYSIFRFVSISRFVIFLIGPNGFVDPRTNSLPGLAHYPCTANGSMQFVPCHFCLSQALKGSSKFNMQSLFGGTEAIALHVAQRIFEQIQRI